MLELHLHTPTCDFMLSMGKRPCSCEVLVCDDVAEDQTWDPPEAGDHESVEDPPTPLTDFFYNWPATPVVVKEVP